MGRGATKAQGNVWYRARMEAAKGNEKLSSRFGAAEEMGLSEDAVKSAELGLYKSMPVENAVLMADCYRAPELLNHYCLEECPIGCGKPISQEVIGIDLATVRMLRLLEKEKLTQLKARLLEVAEDGEVTDEDLPSLREIVKYLKLLSKTISELLIIGNRALGGEEDG